MERDDESTPDYETDDDKAGNFDEHDDSVGGGCCEPSAPARQHTSTGQKRGRSASPAPVPPPKKSKHARKHKKARYAREERLEREGHLPRPKVVQRNIKAGAGIKTTLDSARLPAAHGAYVAKNGAETSPGKKYLPADLDAMGLSRIPWNGM